MIIMKNVLIATDFSDASVTAMNYARELARSFGATLHVLHVADDVSRLVYGEGTAPPLTDDLQATIERTSAEQLRSFVDDSDRRELHAKPVLRVSNDTAKIIVEYAKEAAIDVIVVGTSGRGMVDRLLMGSVADKVMRRAPCPVLAVRTQEREFIRPDALQIVA
jgi:nucleotide-binding universal stress UspA family protein